MEESGKGSDSGSASGKSLDTRLEEVIFESEDLMYEILQKRKLLKNVIKERLTQRLEEIQAKQQEISTKTINLNKVDDDCPDNDNVTAVFPLQCYDEV